MIAKVPLQELTAGSLARLFAQGNVAVLVQCPDLVSEIWRELLENEQEQMPWQAPLVNIARNYHGCGDITASLGDLFYFQPGRHSYIARKIALSREEEAGAVAASPPSFVQDSGCYKPSQAILHRCWSLGQLLMAAISPDGALPDHFQVTVQRLKYQETSEDFAKLGDLSRNSMGRWGRIGCMLDQHRWEAAGALSPRGLSDLYGFIMQVPVVRQLAKRINEMLRVRDATRQLRPGERLIEGAHYDYRYVTALCGRRDRILTQVFAGGEWHDLAIDLNTLAVFPGTLASRAFGLPNVLHRVVHVEGDPKSPQVRNPRTDDVTLLIGAV